MELLGWVVGPAGAPRSLDLTSKGAEQLIEGRSTLKAGFGHVDATRETDGCILGAERIHSVDDDRR